MESRYSQWILSVVMVLALSPVAGASTIAFIDVNGSKGTPPAPDGNGNYWNAITSGTLGTNVALTSTANTATGSRISGGSITAFLSVGRRPLDRRRSVLL